MSEITIEGIVSSVIFSNPDNGYTILRVDTGDGTVTAAGTIPGAAEGERLTISGAWTTHPQYGQQLKVDSFKVKPPSGADEILRYLSSGIIKNIGPSKARDIVAKFGAESLSVIEHEPEKLANVKGISMKSAQKIGEGYRCQAGLRRLIDFLANYGVKPVIATRIYRDYADESVEAVRENPYILADGAYGAEFSEADAIALALGFEADCPERVSAALIFELTHNLANGHTFIPKDKLTAAAGELIGAGRDVIEDSLEAVCECGDIVIETIAGVDGCYLRNMHHAESYTAGRIAEMVKDMSPCPPELHGIISDIERGQGLTYAKLQIAALEIAAGSGVMVLTGGPGTGKTTTVRGILMLFDALGLKTALCAPTGRAAKRLSETCRREASTIHRMLGASPGAEGDLEFEHDESNPLKADAVIVDESSMIDILLMSSLLAAMKRGSRLVMVGDADQLPPIGPGRVFSDLISSGIVAAVALTEIFRQAEDSGIVRCAHSVNNGVMPDLSIKYKDLYFMRRNTEEQLAETVAELYGKRLPDNMGIDPSQIQVLTPTRKRKSGTIQLNELLREAVNPRHKLKKEKQYGDYIFRTGDKVMQIRNNYDIVWKSSDGLTESTGVFNGDVGRITDIDFEREIVTVDFEDKLVTYLFDQLSELEPAFAMTVHKSQGSEYNAVILSMTAAAPPLLTRSVLYTAMTRAKNLLVIVGSLDIMERMVYNDRRQKRYSGLRARLVGLGFSKALGAEM